MTNSYTIAAGAGSLTLSGSAQVIAEGTHEISANILGSAGLTKTGLRHRDAVWSKHIHRHGQSAAGSTLGGGKQRLGERSQCH